MIKKNLITFIIVLFCQICLTAQSPYSAGVYLGMSSHGSDVNSVGRHGQSMFEQNKLAFGFFGSYAASENVELRLSMTFTSLEGDDRNLIDKEPYGQEHFNRGFQYASDLTELGLSIQYYLKSTPSRKRSFLDRLRPYISTGFAWAFVNDDLDQRSWGNVPTDRVFDIQMDQEQGAKGGFQIPLGLGCNLYLTESWSLNLMYSSRLPISDYLDGISESANPDKNDAYQFCGTELIYNF